jgi:hypothetical protein
MSSLVDQIKALLRDVVKFSGSVSGVQLRLYQQDVARAVVDSILYHRGLSIVVVFPRQSGKNELQAQIETYLLTLLSETDAEIIKVSPTWKPQSLNAMRRLERILSKNILTRQMWVKQQGYIYRIGRARIFFLSGSPEANIVGATASTLLEVDEAQDVLTSKFDRDISPMAASTNATRVFWGTAWTSRTLLARELRAAQAAERRDGIRRVFRLTADDVAAEVPAYGLFVADQVAKLGRNNPMVRTQFYSEEIDQEGGMFPAERLALMVGNHPTQNGPTPGRNYALLLDVAGEDEGASDESNGELVNKRRDSTALTLVEVDLTTLADPVLKAPAYRLIRRWVWAGVKHSRIYGELAAVAVCWGAKFIVCDATGVGAGLASFLDKAFPGRVVPFVFNASTKSMLGWNYLGVIDTGRWKEAAGGDPHHETFVQQLSFCRYEVVPGPGKIMRWGVPDGTRDPATGELVHDDLLISAALCTVLDDKDWSVSGPAVMIRRQDPLREMDQGF